MTLLYDPEAGWTFELEDGTRRALRDPEGLPTPMQVYALAARGLLGIRSEPGAPLTKLECAQALDAARELEGVGGMGHAVGEETLPDPASQIFLSAQEKRREP